MIWVRLTVVLIFITWAFNIYMENHYQKHPLELPRKQMDGKLTGLEIIFSILSVVTMIGMAYSCVYMLFFWK